MVINHFVNLGAQIIFQSYKDPFQCFTRVTVKLSPMAYNMMD